MLFNLHQRTRLCIAVWRSGLGVTATEPCAQLNAWQQPADAARLAVAVDLRVRQGLTAATTHHHVEAALAAACERRVLCTSASQHLMWAMTSARLPAALHENIHPYRRIGHSAGSISPTSSCCWLCPSICAGWMW